MSGSLRSRHDCGKVVRQSETRPRPQRPHTTVTRCNHPSYRLIGNFTPVTIPKIKNIPWRFCTRWDEQPAGKLGKSLLRLGICRPQDWTGSAVDFVERGYKRFCKENGATEAGEIWKGNLRIMDSMFDMSEHDYYNSRADRNEPPDTLFLIGDYEQAASIPIGATLPYLEREHAQLPSAFYRVFVHALNKWMRVYDYTDAVYHAEMMMECTEEEDLQDSYLRDIAKSVPPCLPNATSLLTARMVSRAVSFLEANRAKFRNSIVRRLVHDVLELHHECFQYQHSWPSQLVKEVPGLEEYLSETDGCGPGCAITWYEDDCISAAFDEQVRYIGQDGPLEPSIMMCIKLYSRPERLDREVKQVFNHVSAMLRSLRIAARIVEQVRDIYDGYLRENRKKSGLQAMQSPTSLRQQ